MLLSLKQLLTFQKYSSALLTFSVLSVTYVDISSFHCMLLATYVIYFVLCPCAIGDICHRCFISLNFAGLLSILVIISTQFTMTLHSENDSLNAVTFNMFNGYFLEFVQCFCSKTYHFTGNWGASTIEHVCEVELYNILSTLDKF